ncbi:MAG: methylated-DNA--[protein]-cysteine S-methyltransferase [Alistipes sp.]|nr:methylated-DNA--[protein]-cysteine S-methyltransferase [Alistipes sp.]
MGIFADVKIYESDDTGEIGRLRYAFSESRFGEVLTACDNLGLCFAGFVCGGGRDDALADMKARFPAARFEEDASAVVDVFGVVGALHIAGTPFRRRVWRTLLEVRRGERLSYSQLAAAAGVPRAVRAVASAVAANPISVAIPCHRVVRNDGTIGNYHWGAGLKRLLLEAEAH